MSREIFLRICADVLLLAGIFLFPYWLVVAAGLFVAVYIPYYYEFIIFIAFNEILYHPGGTFFSEITTFLLPLALLLLIETTRNFIRERVLSR